VPAVFRDARGRDQLFLTGNTKRAAGVADSVPPSLVRVAVVRDGAAPYPRVERANTAVVFGNPGSPVVTSHGSDDAIVWVLDENANGDLGLVVGFGTDKTTFLVCSRILSWSSLVFKTMLHGSF
jgi:hypothetical protein